MMASKKNHENNKLFRWQTGSIKQQQQKAGDGGEIFNMNLNFAAGFIDLSDCKSAAYQ